MDASLFTGNDVVRPGCVQWRSASSSPFATMATRISFEPSPHSRPATGSFDGTAHSVAYKRNIAFASSENRRDFSIKCLGNDSMNEIGLFIFPAVRIFSD